MFGIATSALCAVQYGLNNSTVTFIICCVGVLRSLTALAGMKNPEFNTWHFLVFFLMLSTYAFAFLTDWEKFTFIDALPIMGTYLGTLAVFSKRMWGTKAFYIAGGIVWLTYDFATGYYTQMIGEGFSLFANILALTLIVRATKAGANEDSLKDIDAEVIGALTGSIPIVAVREVILTGSLPIINAEKIISSSRMLADTIQLPIITKASSPVQLIFPETGNLERIAV